MAATESIHHSGSKTTCAKCGDTLVAPEWSQYMGEQRVFNLWSCTKCGSSFADVSVSMTADTKTSDDAKKDDALQPMLVA